MFVSLVIPTCLKNAWSLNRHILSCLTDNLKISANAYLELPTLPISYERNNYTLHVGTKSLALSGNFFLIESHTIWTDYITTLVDMQICTSRIENVSVNVNVK